MTRKTSKLINCPHCGNPISMVWEENINTWVDHDLIQKIINDDYNFYCTICNKATRLITKILINCPERKFWISTGDDVKTNIMKLKKYKVINEKGEILKPNSLDSLNFNITNSGSNISNDLDKLEKTFLKKNKNELDKNS